MGLMSSFLKYFVTEREKSRDATVKISLTYQKRNQLRKCVETRYSLESAASKDVLE